MPMLVLVQNNPAVDALTAPVSRHARALGLDLVDLNLDAGLDFGAAGIDYAAPERVLLHGSVGFLRLALRHPPLARRLSWNEDAFRASAWADALGPFYLGHGGARLPARDVATRLARGGRLAVRPEIGLKGFPGGVYDHAAWIARSVPDDLPCFAAPPSLLLEEHRVWFVGGAPVAGSRYRSGDRAAKDAQGVEEAMEAAAGMMAGRLPLDDVVVDVTRTPEGMRVIELNCIHTAGWHAVDPARVVEALAGLDAPVPALAGPR